jgi:hypothetical protein
MTNCVFLAASVAACALLMGTFRLRQGPWKLEECIDAIEVGLEVDEGSVGRSMERIGGCRGGGRLLGSPGSAAVAADQQRGHSADSA